MKEPITRARSSPGWSGGSGTPGTEHPGVGLVVVALPDDECRLCAEFDGWIRLTSSPTGLPIGTGLLPGLLPESEAGAHRAGVHAAARAQDRDHGTRNHHLRDPVRESEILHVDGSGGRVGHRCRCAVSDRPTRRMVGSGPLNGSEFVHEDRQKGRANGGRSRLRPRFGPVFVGYCGNGLPFLSGRSTVCRPVVGRRAARA